MTDPTTRPPKAEEPVLNLTRLRRNLLLSVPGYLLVPIGIGAAAMSLWDLEISWPSIGLGAVAGGCSLWRFEAQ